jgi:hypothetical protein
MSITKRGLMSQIILLLMFTNCKYKSDKNCLGILNTHISNNNIDSALQDIQLCKYDIRDLSDKDKILYSNLYLELNGKKNALKLLQSLKYDNPEINYLAMLYASTNQLWKTEEWKLIEQNCFNGYTNSFKKFDKLISMTLDTILLKDQIPRITFKMDSCTKFISQFVKQIGYFDDQNFEYVKNLLDTESNLNKLIPRRSFTTIVMVILHKPDCNLKKKYLGRIKAFYENNLINGQYYAMLVDKITICEQNVQIYGTQYHFNEKTNKNQIDSLVDTDQIDSLRSSVGLTPIKEYLELINGN